MWSNSLRPPCICERVTTQTFTVAARDPRRRFVTMSRSKRYKPRIVSENVSYVVTRTVTYIVSLHAPSDAGQVIDLGRAQSDPKTSQRHAPRLGVEAHVVGLTRAVGQVGQAVGTRAECVRNARAGWT